MAPMGSTNILVLLLALISIFFLGQTQAQNLPSPSRPPPPHQPPPRQPPTPPPPTCLPCVCPILPPPPPTSSPNNPAPVLTINSPDGDLVDCIEREDQPALRNPILKNHTIQDPPSATDIPYIKNEAEYYKWKWQVWHKNGTRCPEGSIPVRRLIDIQTGTSGSNSGDRATRGHEYAIGRIEKENRSNIYGTQATINVWHPHIEGPDEFSLGQVWVTSGSYLTNSLNSMETGWQVYPWLYGDDRPRLFLYWTTDAYTDTGCYNLRCGGFVQTSKSVMIEGAISQISIFGGYQADLTIRIWKDHSLESWWLGIVIDDVLEPIGYWPTVLFTLQKNFAEMVEWGGEILNHNPFGRHTKTQMGSGFFPGSGTGKAAYIRNLKVALSENQFQPLLNLEVAASPYYRVNKFNNSVFYYGGPEQSKADYLMLDCFILFCCFSLFFIV